MVISIVKLIIIIWLMKTKILALVLGALLTIPCMLYAEEVEIQLTEVVEMGVLPGDDPLDGPTQSPDVPPRPNDFRASINGNSLSVSRQNSAIPFAQATVVKVSNGSVVLNQQFTSSLLQQIPSSGVYVLHIQTAGGALVGQFVVQ